MQSFYLICHNVRICVTNLLTLFSQLIWQANLKHEVAEHSSDDDDEEFSQEEDEGAHTVDHTNSHQVRHQ